MEICYYSWKDSRDTVILSKKETTKQKVNFSKKDTIIWKEDKAYFLSILAKKIFQFCVLFSYL